MAELNIIFLFCSMNAAAYERISPGYAFIKHITNRSPSLGATASWRPRIALYVAIRRALSRTTSSS